jgi:hypothetical protein
MAFVKRQLQREFEALQANPALVTDVINTKNAPSPLATKTKTSLFHLVMFKYAAFKHETRLASILLRPRLLVSKQRTQYFQKQS